jgi:hypothetical protein
VGEAEGKGVKLGSWDPPDGTLSCLETVAVGGSGVREGVAVGVRTAAVFEGLAEAWTGVGMGIDTACPLIAEHALNSVITSKKKRYLNIIPGL